MLRNLAMLLLDRGRVVALPAISRELGVLVDAHANRVRARVTSARPLAPEVEAKLRTQLEARLGKRVVLERREDPGLIGGLTTEVGDLFFDGSLRYHMETLRKQLEEA
jgi:F-type H+-transporting ATPase subunit delta